MVSVRENRYLDVISTPQQIHDLPMNTSVSKHLYSFSKSERFPERSYRANCSEAFYEIPQLIYRNKRSCSMGKGSKSDFTKTRYETPPPNAYNPQNNSIAFNDAMKPGIGVSREMAPQMGILPYKSEQLPGPGAYNPQSVPSQKTCQFRIKLKNKTDFVNPNGPGSYDILRCFEPTQRVPLSQFKSVQNVKIAPVPLKISREQPQPELFYDTKFQMNKTGVFFNSKYSNSLCRTFGKSPRNTAINRQSYASPGYYRLPSDFGFYESSTCSKKSKVACAES